jgi:hypothetical protein
MVFHSGPPAKHGSPLRGPTMKYLSPLLSAARGSIGGATASRNRGGNYFRERIAPVQPRTPAQQAIRASLASLAAAWRGLTALEIAGWNATASTITRTDALGTSYTLTGEQLYVGNNQNLIDAGEATTATPPASAYSFIDLQPVDAAAAAGAATFIVTTGAAAAPAGTVFIVRATPQLSAGISSIGASRRRIIGFFPDTDFASINVKAVYVARFGALTAGSTIGVSLTMVDTVSGFQSIANTLTIKVAA